jgi:hypothetical protein
MGKSSQTLKYSTTYIDGKLFLARKIGTPLPDLPYHFNSWLKIN